MAGGSRSKYPVGGKRRLTGEARRQAIIESAAQLFAEQGFGGTTRELAARLGVTQGLLYRYFPTKHLLIEAVFAQFRGRWDASRAALLADRSKTLVDRLLEFYMAYIGRHGHYPATRLFMHAALAGLDIPRRYGEDLDSLVFGPVLDAICVEAGVKPARRPLGRDMRELVMGLHGAIVFVGIRRFIYRIAIDDARHREIVRNLIVRNLPGMLAAIK